LVGNRTFAQRNVKHDTISAHSILSPFDFGLETAETDSARYEVLYATHAHAVATGANVSYAGIESLTIEVPSEAAPIPLTRNSDFGGMTLTVKNYSKAKYLFSLTDTIWNSIELKPEVADNGNFTEVEGLNEGIHLVVLEDLHPWVDNRTGYNYGAMRKDILLVRDGRAQNRPISPYSTDSTLLSAKTHFSDEELKTITGITIIRDTSSTAKTYCFYIDGINNLKIKRVNIYTLDPKNMYADNAIHIVNCTNITFEDVLIEGTYSRTSNYGYGILMNNVWNSTFLRLTAHANWGIFGTNNLSNTTLRNCDINRFDIHCYGRDAYIYNCMFSKLYNQFSSVFGTVLFDGCHFSDFVPVLIETSYNAYTPFDLTFKNCTFDAYSSRNYLISIGKVDKERNSRPELAQKCWPNIQIQNMTVNVKENLSKVILFYPKGQISGNVGYISNVKINGLKFQYYDTIQPSSFVICNTGVISKNPINYEINNMELIPTVDQMKKQAEKKFVYPGSLVINLRKDKSNKVNISKSRLNFNVNENSQYNIDFTSCDVGMIRYNSNSNGTKRIYSQCKLYLNNSDDARYYIDNQATYNKCTFIPCDDKMFISFYGSSNDVVIKNCKTTRKGRIFYMGRKDNAELRGYQVKGQEKFWK
jgi:hypothetical protein